MPRPRLQEDIHRLMQSGIVYIHGRTKDHSPILVLDFIKLSELLKKKQITNQSFCALHNHYGQYIDRNMLIPGQAERWVTITNINQFAIKDLPLSMFKLCARELSVNFIDRASRANIVNLTWMQTTLAKFL